MQRDLIFCNEWSSVYRQEIQRSLGAVPAVPDIYEGRQAYKGVTLEDKGIWLRQLQYGVTNFMRMKSRLSTKGDFDIWVGYSKDLVHVYEVKGVELKELTEIEAHDVHVSDLAFLTVDRSLLLVTYGNEHIVKNARTGLIRHTLQGHHRAVCSISLCHRAQMQVIYAIDGMGIE
ncbi:topless-related protein 4-like protein isoform X1 [Tanacetum coccineum]